MILNIYTTSGLSILMHGFISLKDATTYDKSFYSMINFLCVSGDFCHLLITFANNFRGLEVVKFDIYERTSISG